MVQPNAGNFLQIGLQLGQTTVLINVLDAAHLAHRCLHHFVQIGGFAVHGSVHIIAHFLHNTHIFQLHHGVVGANNAEEIDNAFTILQINDELIFSIGQLGL